MQRELQLFNELSVIYGQHYIVGGLVVPETKLH